MTEKILLACMGGSCGVPFKPCGLVGDGFPTVVLAATPAVKEMIEAVGADHFEELWEHAYPDQPPGAGGLWVLECDLEDDDDGDTSDDDEDLLEVGQHLRPVLWRQPTTDELNALLERALQRANAIKVARDEFERSKESHWVFDGGLV